MKVNKICPLCGKVHSIQVDDDKYTEFIEILLLTVKRLFPELSNEEQGVLLSGICKECQDFIFKEDE